MGSQNTIEDLVTRLEIDDRVETIYKIPLRKKGLGTLYWVVLAKPITVQEQMQLIQNYDEKTRFYDGIFRSINGSEHYINFTAPKTEQELEYKDLISQRTGTESHHYAV